MMSCSFDRSEAKTKFFISEMFVGRILAPVETHVGRVCLGVLSPHAQEWPDQPGAPPGNTAKPIQPSPADGAEEHRLGLIVSVMGSQDDGGGPGV